MSKLIVKILLLLVIQLLAMTCFAEANETTLPLTFSQDAPAITVEIQGKNIPLIFDTGDASDAITLSPEALQNLKVHFTGQQVCADSLSGKDCMQSFIIPELKIGDFVLQNVQGQLMPHIWGNDKGLVMTQAWKDGVIGLPLLKNFGVLIDYPNDEIVLTKNFQMPNIIDKEDWVKIPFTFDKNISTTAEINGSPLKIVWDTGAIPSSIRSDIPINANISECPDRYKIVIPQCKRIKTTNFTMSKQKLDNTWFIVRDMPQLPFDALLGSNFFANNLVFIDFKNNTLSVKTFMLITDNFDI